MEDTSERQYPASILVVDDSRISGRKLVKAATALGHRADHATSGVEALDVLRKEPVDVVLLDIVMPDMDGYEVLKSMKADATLRDIPVVVVSSLDDEIGSVARAIELGAEDFLPKNFEPAILRARINASLVRKRFRDRELDYLRDIERLTRAAQVIEHGAFRPDEMDIDAVAARPDPLGRLAAVFRGLAEEIYDRERRADVRPRDCERRPAPGFGGGQHLRHRARARTARIGNLRAATWSCVLGKPSCRNSLHPLLSCAIRHPAPPHC